MLGTQPFLTSAYLTATQSAAYLGYHVKTFRGLAFNGFIPRYGLKNNRYRKEDLDAFMLNPYVFIATKKSTPCFKTSFSPVTL